MLLFYHPVVMAVRQFSIIIGAKPSLSLVLGNSWYLGKVDDLVRLKAMKSISAPQIRWIQALLN